MPKLISRSVLETGLNPIPGTPSWFSRLYPTLLNVLFGMTGTGKSVIVPDLWHKSDAGSDSG
jgi:hypothetical protein